MRKIILRSLLCLFVSIVGYFSYEIYFAELIQDYFRGKVVDRMNVNFYNHENDFQELVEFSKNFNEIDGLEFLKDGTIDFSLHDLPSRTYNRYINYDNIWLTERNDSTFLVQGNLEFLVEKIEFSKTNSAYIFLKYEDKQGIDTLDNWTIHYRGVVNNPLLKQLIDYQNIDFEKFKFLRKKVEKLNCHSFEKTNGVITLHYVGRAIDDYLAYKINIGNSLSMQKYSLIKENYYWHYQPSSFCLMNPKNWYGEAKID